MVRSRDAAVGRERATDGAARQRRRRAAAGSARQAAAAAHGRWQNVRLDVTDATAGRLVTRPRRGTSLRVRVRAAGDPARGDARTWWRGAAVLVTPHVALHRAASAGGRRRGRPDHGAGGLLPLTRSASAPSSSSSSGRGSGGVADQAAGAPPSTATSAAARPPGTSGTRASPRAPGECKPPTPPTKHTRSPRAPGAGSSSSEATAGCRPDCTGATSFSVRKCSDSRTRFAGGRRLDPEHART